jgi:hypothetical protein
MPDERMRSERQKDNHDVYVIVVRLSSRTGEEDGTLPYERLDYHRPGRKGRSYGRRKWLRSPLSSLW